MAKRVAEIESVIHLKIDGDKEAISKINSVENAVESVEKDGQVDLAFKVNDKGAIKEISSLKKQLEASGFKVQIDIDTDYWKKQLNGEKEELASALQKAFKIDFNKVNTSSLDNLNKQLAQQKTAYEEQIQLIKKLETEKEKMRKNDLKSAYKNYQNNNSVENKGKFLTAYESYTDNTKEPDFSFTNNKKKVTYKQLSEIYDSIIDDETVDIDSLDDIQEKAFAEQEANFKKLEAKIKEAHSLKSQIEQEISALETQIKNYDTKKSEQETKKASKEETKTHKEETAKPKEAPKASSESPTEIKVVPDLTELYNQLSAVKSTPLDVVVDISNKATVFDEIKAKPIDVTVNPQVDPNFKLKINNAEIGNIQQSTESVMDAYNEQYKKIRSLSGEKQNDVAKQLLENIAKQSSVNDQEIAKLLGAGQAYKNKNKRAMNLKKIAEGIGFDLTSIDPQMKDVSKQIVKIQQEAKKEKAAQKKATKTEVDKVVEQNTEVKIIPDLTELYNQLTAVKNTPLTIDVQGELSSLSTENLEKAFSGLGSSFQGSGSVIESIAKQQKQNIDELTVSVKELAAELNKVGFNKISEVPNKEVKKQLDDQQKQDKLENSKKLKADQDAFLNAVRNTNGLDLKSLSINDEDGYASLSASIYNADKTITNLKVNLKDLSAVLTDNKIDLDKLKQASDNVNISLNKLNISDKLREKAEKSLQEVDLINPKEIGDGNSVLENLYQTNVIEKIDENKDNIKKILDAPITTKNDLEEATTQLKEYIATINELSNAYKKTNKQGDFIGSLTSDIKTKENEKDIKKELNNLLTKQKGYNVKDLMLTHNNFGELTGAKASIVSDGQIKKATIAFQQYGSAIQGASASVRILTSSEKEYQSMGSRWVSGFKKKLMSLSQYITGIEVVQRLWQEVKQGFSFVQEMNSALTTINQTMSVSASALDRLGKSSIQTGIELGTTAQNVLDAVAIYANANETAGSILEKSKPTIMLANASGADTATAADQIQGVVQQFDELEGQERRIVNSYEKISAGVAIDFAKILALKLEII